MTPHPSAAERASRGRQRWWAAWWRLPWSDRRSFLAAVVLIPAIATSLRVLDLRRTLAWVERGIRYRPLSPLEEPAVVRRAIIALRRAQRYGPNGGTCLSRSLALKWLLGRRGIMTELRLGARLTDGRLEAHAWVERGGVVLNETPDVASRFTPFRAIRPPEGPLRESPPADTRRV